MRFCSTAWSALYDWSEFDMLVPARVSLPQGGFVVMVGGVVAQPAGLNCGLSARYSDPGVPPPRNGPGSRVTISCPAPATFPCAVNGMDCATSSKLSKCEPRWPT